MFDLESCLVCPPPFGEQWKVRANYWRRWNQLSIDFFDGFNLRLFSIEKHEAKKTSRLWRNFLFLILTPTQIKKEKDMLWRWRMWMTNTELQTWGIQTDSNKDAKQIYLFINRWKYCANIYRQLLKLLQRKREQNMKMTKLCELEGTRSTATTVKAAFADQQYWSEIDDRQGWMVDIEHQY